MSKTNPKTPPRLPPSSLKPASMPRVLVEALPSAVPLLDHIRQVEAAVPALRKELERAHKGGGIQMARAFVVLHRLVERIEQSLRPLTHDDPEKPGLFEEYKKKIVPEVFDHEGVTSIPLAEGYRVGVSYTFRASIKAGMKDKAYEWLRENAMPDLITTTVNASSLSSAFKELVEEKNIDPPEDLFNAAKMPTTSVTKT